MISIPEVLYFTEYGGVDLVKILKLIYYNCEMPACGFFHDYFEQVSEICNLTIYMNAHLFFEFALELLAKSSLAVF